MDRKLTIILTDDDEDDRDFFRMAVEDAGPGHNLIMFQDGVELKEYLFSSPPELPDLIFLDINMPLMDGFQCLEAIRTLYPPDELPVIIYTTSSSDRDRLRCIELGANRYLVKPNDFKILKSVIAGVLNEYKYTA